ncbi:MAG: VWA domain-containing protein [Treponema sp.]|nr:VWA domain-containing protein [Treponema sp.]
MAKKILWLCAVILVVAPVFGQDLSLGGEDLLIELRSDGGFHLFIRRKPGIASVLLTESTRDPALAAHNFAYRAREWNAINGDEIRLLDGAPIPRESGIFSLVSSTPVEHPLLGTAFHVYIPWVLQYGHPPGRHGEVFVGEGTYINIRAFELPYADYRGAFADNPFVLQALQQPTERPLGNFRPEAESAFAEIAKDGGGRFSHAVDAASLMRTIEDTLRAEAGSEIDIEIVLCLDTTGSMGPYMAEIRRELVPLLREVTAEFTEWRIGAVRFKDYFEEYLTRLVPFTNDFNVLQRSLNAIGARGGGDIPEAVYEGLHDAVNRFPWSAERRIIILVGDAPPHPAPRGKITRNMVFDSAAEKNITIDAIVVAR